MAGMFWSLLLVLDGKPCQYWVLPWNQMPLYQSGISGCGCRKSFSSVE